MPLETATHISDLVVTNPASSDGLNQADDHMRLIKGVLLNDISDAMTSKSLTVPDGTSAAPTIGFKADATVGFYRKASGQMGLVGRLMGATADVGSLHMFLVEPPGLGKGGTGTGFAYLELDGSTWPNSAFPDLAAHLNQGGTTFTLPNAYNTGKFPRSRTATVAAGTTQANQFKTHTHQVTGDTGNNSVDHTHSYSGTTGVDSPDHTHSVGIPTIAGANNNNGGGGGAFAAMASTMGTTGTGGASSRHAHSFGGTTTGAGVAHTHHLDVTSAATGAVDETRPEALSVVLCIKT